MQPNFVYMVRPTFKRSPRFSKHLLNITLILLHTYFCFMYSLDIQYSPDLSTPDVIGNRLVALKLI